MEEPPALAARSRAGALHTDASSGAGVWPWTSRNVVPRAGLGPAGARRPLVSRYRCGGIVGPFSSPAAAARASSPSAPRYSSSLLVISNQVVPIGALFDDAILPPSPAVPGTARSPPTVSGTLGLPSRPRQRMLGGAPAPGTESAASGAGGPEGWRTDARSSTTRGTVTPRAPAPTKSGQLAADSGRDAEALPCDSAIAVWPSYIPAYQEKGVVLGRMGRWPRPRVSARRSARAGYDAAHTTWASSCAARGAGGGGERARKALRSTALCARRWPSSAICGAIRGGRTRAADAYRHAVVAGARGPAHARRARGRRRSVRPRPRDGDATQVQPVRDQRPGLVAGSRTVPPPQPRDGIV